MKRYCPACGSMIGKITDLRRPENEMLNHYQCLRCKKYWQENTSTLYYGINLIQISQYRFLRLKQG